MGKKRRKRKIRIRESAKLVHKADNTRVSRPDAYNLSPTPMPHSNSVVFKVKIRKK